MLISLLGSDEFEPWTNDIDKELVAKSVNPNGTVLIFPTASAPEGDEVFNSWGQKGVEHFKNLGFKAKTVNLKTAKDANKQEIISELKNASLIYFSGGNPAYVAQIFGGSRFCDELKKAVNRGVSYAGCSAGASMLGANTFDTNVNSLSPALFKNGLDFFKDVVICPHWDAVDDYLPGLSSYVKDAFKHLTMLTIDEKTLIFGDGKNMTVFGAGKVTTVNNLIVKSYSSGESLVLN